MIRQLTSVQNPLVKHLVKLRQNRDYRYDHQSLFIEGTKLLSEIGRDHHLKALLAYDQALIPPGLTADETYIVNEAVMKKISGLSTPEGLAAEVAMPKPADLSSMKRVVALDGINDPGNLGAILRTALALGWKGVFILEESCDPYNEKALRASRGAQFRLPIMQGSWADLREIVKKNGLQTIAADLKGTAIEEVSLSNGVVLLLGNEAHGISPEARSFCQPVTISMPGEMESLNVAVAAGIIMYLLRS